MKKIVTYLSTISLTGLSFLLSISRSSVNAAPAPIENIPITFAPTDLNPVDIIQNIGGWLLAAAGALVVVYLIYGGILYITGGPKAEENAKKVIMNALIGLIVITLAYALANFAITLVK